MALNAEQLREDIIGHLDPDHFDFKKSQMSELVNAIAIAVVTHITENAEVPVDSDIYPVR